MATATKLVKAGEAAAGIRLTFKAFLVVQLFEEHPKLPADVIEWLADRMILGDAPVGQREQRAWDAALKDRANFGAE